MGEYAEMMLDGTCCEACGEFIGESIGFPRYCCKACEPDDTKRSPVYGTKPFACGKCSRRFKTEAAMQQHASDKHKG